MVDSVHSIVERQKEKGVNRLPDKLKLYEQTNRDQAKWIKILKEKIQRQQKKIKRRLDDHNKIQTIKKLLNDEKFDDRSIVAGVVDILDFRG